MNKLFFGPLLMILLACHAEIANAAQRGSFQQCLQDLCGSGDTLGERHHRSVLDSVEKSLPELENTPWGQVLTQKIDVHYGRREKVGIFESEEEKKAFEAQIEKTLQEMANSSAFHPETYPVYGQMSVFILAEGSSVFSNYIGNPGEYRPERRRHWELVQAIQVFLSSPPFLLQEMASYSIERFLRLKYEELPLQEALLQYIDDAIGVQNRDRKNTGGIFSTAFGLPGNLAELKIKAQNRQITEQEMTILVESNFVLSYLDILLDYQDRYGEEIIADLYAMLQSWLEQKTPAEKMALVGPIVEYFGEEGGDYSSSSRAFGKEVCLRAFDRNFSLYPPDSETSINFKILSPRCRRIWCRIYAPLPIFRTH